MPRVLRRATLGVAALAAVTVLLAVWYSGELRPWTDASAAGDCTADPSLDAEEQAFLLLINAYRAENGLGPLAASSTLSKAAQWKSSDMGANAYFAHDDLFRTWVQRLRDCGYTYNAWLGENIAAGVSGGQAAFDLWKSSPGHAANMLGEHYTAVGIGRAYAPGSPFGWYWTTDFGSVNDGWSAPAPTPTSTLPPPSTPTPVPATPTATPTAAPSTPTSTRTAASTPTAPSAAPSPVHVGDLDSRATGKNRWSARVTVIVHDANERPVGGAVVVGLWNGTATSPCTTDSGGTCNFQLSKLGTETPSATFSVLSVSAAGRAYAAASNHDPDGSSNGTTIVVMK